MLKPTILVIDDESSNVSYITDILEKQNYELLAAFNGKMGFEIAVNKLPDLILMDWDMPVMNGLDSLRLLKKNDSTKQIPVIMISGIMTTTKNLSVAMEAGAIDYIRKPIDEIELIARTRSMLMLLGYYKETLNLKSRELMSFALKDLRNIEFVGKIQESLKILIEQNIHIDKIKNELGTIVAKISSELKSISWNQFETRFKEVNPRFFEQLSSSHPNLSPAEIKLCAFLKLNFSTKEIAALTSLSADGIKTSRARLRKKLNIVSEDNLVAYLMKL